MRQDLAKVICEDGRRGPRGYMGARKGYEAQCRHRNPEDRERDYAHLEALPGKESMTARLRGGGRWFSENLGALRGLISSSCGRCWDDIYSELCQQVRPNGTTVERHVHQHLEEFLVMRTRIGPSGIEGSMSGNGVWKPIQAVRFRQQYFVHPITRMIVRFTQRARRWQSHGSALVRSTNHALIRYLYLRRFWYQIDLEQAVYQPARHQARHRRQSPHQQRVILLKGDRFTLSIANELPQEFFDYRYIPRASVSEVELQRLRLRIFGADLVPVHKRPLTSAERLRSRLIDGSAAAHHHC